MKYHLLFLFCFIGTQFFFAQSKIENFLTPSDSLNIKRQNTVIVSEAVLASVALVGLNQLWYADYPRSNFHFINDNAEWLQMDKAGHFYSAYHLGRFGAEMLQWSGASSKNQMIYGAGFGFAFLTAVEVLDGFSSEWGASPGDVIANAVGTSLYISQELLWKEQRITPKFSFHRTSYANYRPEVLGGTLNEQILKDYNGQTYWLSVNIHSFMKNSKIPKWLNLAVGYGAEGMLSGNVKNSTDLTIYNPERYRQFYLSFDVNLTKIETKSHLLKTIFSVFNTIKIPAPTLEYSPNEGFKGHFLYF
ncbi:YfiM family protein [Flavobacterium sp. LS1R49]|uniref:YfiM family protein n=1 Tax=Flavobacterium shii TaxID=2987687 RepID=A0A9X3C6F5_9FLAO|nr:YfiM family protein [Flavobacterium shii]MCV9926503.1 YfiM family protein [Flavobacterium shii]